MEKFMDLPRWTPARPSDESFAVAALFSTQSPMSTSQAQIEPAACCAEACVDVPFVGRVCRCILDLPICP
jgi:hypothetical protein